MAGPLAGIGQQSVPLSQTFQPGGTEESRAVKQQQQEREPQNNEIQKTRSSQPAQTREVDSENANRSSDSSKQQLTASNSNDPGFAPTRGSVVNITV